MGLYKVIYHPDKSLVDTIIELDDELDVDEIRERIRDNRLARLTDEELVDYRDAHKPGPNPVETSVDGLGGQGGDEPETEAAPPAGGRRRSKD